MKKFIEYFLGVSFFRTFTIATLLSVPFSLIAPGTASALVGGTTEKIDLNGDVKPRLERINRKGGMVATSSTYAYEDDSIVNVNRIYLILPDATEAIELGAYTGSRITGIAFNDLNDVVWELSSSSGITEQVLFSTENGSKIIQLSTDGRHASGKDLAINNNGLVAWIASDTTSGYGVLRLYDSKNERTSTLSTATIKSADVINSLDINDKNQIIWSQRHEGTSNQLDYDLHILSLDTSEKTILSSREIAKDTLPISIDRPVKLINPIINDAGIAAWVMKWKPYFLEGWSHPLSYYEIYKYLPSGGQKVIKVGSGTPGQIEALSMNLHGDLTWARKDWDGVQVPDGQIYTHLLDREVYLYTSDGVDADPLKLSNNDIEDLPPSINDQGEVVWLTRQYENEPRTFQFSYYSTERFLNYNFDVVFFGSHDNPTMGSPQINSQSQIVWYEDDGFDREIYLLEGVGGEIDNITNHYSWSDPVYDDTRPLHSEDGHIAWEGTDVETKDRYVFRFTPSTDNSPPIADAGADQTLACEAASSNLVSLDGSGSHDTDGDSLSYSWSGSFGTSSGVKPDIYLPLGKSTLQLVVNDGIENSTADLVDVTVKVQASGFQPPMGPLVPTDETPVTPDFAFRQGRTLPLRIQISCGDSVLSDLDVSAPAITEIVRVNGSDINMEVSDLNSGKSNDYGSLFRYSEDGNWVYNLGTKNLIAGSYHITVQMPDEVSYVGSFVLK